MTAPFVSSLRSRPGTIIVGDANAANRLNIRVEMPEVWDVVRIVAGANEPVINVKMAAMEALCPTADFHEEFVLKLNGWEVLNEGVTLSEAGAKNGSTFCMLYRRRRPVR